MSEFIRQALIDQKDEINEYQDNLFVDRNVPVDFFSSGLTKIVSGVRRSGKSTLVHLMLKDKQYAYVNFDDERLLGLKSSDLSLIEEYLYGIYGDFKNLFLDEIQNVEGWSLFVNRLYRKKLNIFLSGSNSRLLSKEISSHLTGRFVNLELYPFSFGEFLTYHNFKISGNILSTKEKAQLKTHFEEYLKAGGFPEIVKGEPSQKYASSLFYSIVNRDILLRYNIKHQRTFADIALFLINNYSREISFNRLKNIFGLGSEHTAKNYVHYLKDAFLIFTLSKFSFKKQESLRYKKNYVIDISFIRSLSDDFSQNTGRIYENIVAIELMRRKNVENFEIYYYKNRYEVDFVIRKNLKITELIQVSFDIEDPKTYRREVNALIAAANELNAEKLTIISKNYETEEVIKDKRVCFKPLVYWLLGQ
ncbi:MAG: ATP-binding protein [Chlorobi bacterium]|nr:ATP-binding protein [Chlorobiota bacterium]